MLVIANPSEPTQHVGADLGQTEWLADEICGYNMNVCILGKTYKPDTNLTYGSPAVLLSNILNERNVNHIIVDPQAMPRPIPSTPHVFVIATAWPEFFDYKYPKGSVVIDPWGKMKDQKDIKVIRIGRMPDNTA